MTHDQDPTYTTTVDGFFRENLPGEPDDPDPDLAPATTRDALVSVCLGESITRADGAILSGKGPLAVVVTVPSQQWVRPVIAAMREAWEFTDHASNVRKKPGATDILDEGRRLADTLGGGGRVLGVSHAPTMLLPPSLVGAADVAITVRPPSDRALRRLIRWVTGKRVRHMPKGLATGLDIDVLCAAVRSGSTPADCIRRLTAASQALAGGDRTLVDVPHVRDLVGYGEAGAWARALVSDIEAWRAAGSDPAAFRRLDRMVCLAGPPGTGKTSLARSVAASAGLPFFPSSVASMFTTSSGYLDGVLKSFDDLFAQAVAANGVILLDELDALPNRTTMGSRDQTYWSVLIGHVLTTLSGAASGNAGRIVVIGCTNHPENLDAALIRPGRLRLVGVPLPTREDLATIMRQHLGDDLAGVNLTAAARLAAGATGAKVADWIASARRDAEGAGRQMTLADLLARIAPADRRSPEKILAVARHEVAHALAVEVLQIGSVVSVTIVPTDGAEGFTDWRETHGALPTRDRLETIATGMLCGRAADEAYGVAHAGAGGDPASDLGIATRVVASIHVSYGLSGKLVRRASPDGTLEMLKYDRDLADLVDGHLAVLYARATSFVRAHRDLIDALARRLAVERVIDGDTLRRLIVSSAMPRLAAASRTTNRGGRHA